MASLSTLYVYVPLASMVKEPYSPCKADPSCVRPEVSRAVEVSSSPSPALPFATKKVCSALLSVSELCALPVALSVASSVMLKSVSTLSEGASLVPATLTVTVVVVVPPLPSLTCTSKLSCTFSP